MNSTQSTYHSKIYRDFRAIAAGDWRTIVRFYEECEKDIRELDFDEYFEVLTAYTHALFETATYTKHITFADRVIEISVMNNIKFFQGEDVFQKMLFKKAASLYHSDEFDKADYHLRELLRINPANRDACLFLKKCLRRMKPSFVRQTRAAAVFFFLMSALLICLEMILVRPFYQAQIGVVELSRNALFLLGFGILAGGEAAHYLKTQREVHAFVSGIRRQKRRKKSANAEV
ncbi:MAG: hypothetical protein AAB316_12100 [Bacteroidota bacterium]